MIVKISTLKKKREKNQIFIENKGKDLQNLVKPTINIKNLYKFVSQLG